MFRSFPVAVLGVCLLSAACSDGNSPTSPTNRQPDKVDQTATLQPGQQVNLDGVGFSLTFTGVTNDSRCPGDAICISGGEATVRFQASVAARAGVQVDLSTADPRRTVDLSDLRVELKQLEPYPFASLGPIRAGDYRATVRIASR